MAMKTPYPVPIGKELYVVKTGEWRFQKPVVDGDKCTLCGICWIFCPTNSIKERADRYEPDLDTCKGCGICAHECHAAAIAMVVESKE